MSQAESFEIVTVGSGGVGKSCLTVRFLKDEFFGEYDPTVEENYRKTVVVDGQSCDLSIVDTAGQHEYSALRDQHLSSGDGFLLVFALNDKVTFEELKQLRQRILQAKDKKKLPFVICGNKCDLPKEQLMAREEIQQWCQSLKMPYFDTSAKANINVTEAFQEVVRQCRKDKVQVSPKKEKEKGGSCCVIA